VIQRLKNILTLPWRGHSAGGNHSFPWGWQYHRIWAHDGGCHVDKEGVWKGIGKGKALEDHLFHHQVFSFPFHHVHCHLITPRTSATNNDIIPVNKHPFMFSCLVIINFHIFSCYMFFVSLTSFLLQRLNFAHLDFTPKDGKDLLYTGILIWNFRLESLSHRIE